MLDYLFIVEPNVGSTMFIVWPDILTKRRMADEITKDALQEAIEGSHFD